MVIYMDSYHWASDSRNCLMPKEDKRLLLVVANQIATFIENMKLISRMAEEERNARELEMAAEVQRHLFPADGLEDDAWRSTAPASQRSGLEVIITITLKLMIVAQVSLLRMSPARESPPPC